MDFLSIFTSIDYVLFVICYVLFVMCYLLFVICYLLFVICGSGSRSVVIQRIRRVEWLWVIGFSPNN